jgi:hypothetical protein
VRTLKAQRKRRRRRKRSLKVMRMKEEARGVKMALRPSR